MCHNLLFVQEHQNYQNLFKVFHTTWYHELVDYDWSPTEGDEWLVVPMTCHSVYSRWWYMVHNNVGIDPPLIYMGMLLVTHSHHDVPNGVIGNCSLCFFSHAQSSLKTIPVHCLISEFGHVQYLWPTYAFFQFPRRMHQNLRKREGTQYLVTKLARAFILMVTQHWWTPLVKNSHT